MFGNAMCSFMELTSRTECHASRKSLCLQTDDRSSVLIIPGYKPDIFRPLVCSFVFRYIGGNLMKLTSTTATTIPTTIRTTKAAEYQQH